jgi:pimeloyl-ACP methyl ester carboxylesterase
MPFARINGVELFYATTGEGPPLLLVAGIASDHLSWLPVVAPLAARFQLIMPDNRGSGQTIYGDAPASLPAMAQDCAALLDHLGVGSANVIGHSMGGVVAAILAASQPERVRRLVVAASAARLSRRNRELMSDFARLRAAGVDEALFYRLFFYWLFRDDFFEDAAAVEEAVQLAAAYPHRQQKEGFLRQVEALLDFDAEARLQEIRAPLLILGGACDRLVAPKELSSYARALDARVQLIGAAAHSLHWDDPAAFVAAVLEFLEG